jgi:hypothetical protein
MQGLLELRDRQKVQNGICQLSIEVSSRITFYGRKNSKTDAPIKPIHYRATGSRSIVPQTIRAHLYHIAVFAQKVKWMAFGMDRVVLAIEFHGHFTRKRPLPGALRYCKRSRISQPTKPAPMIHQTLLFENPAGKNPASLAVSVEAVPSPVAAVPTGVPTEKEY